MNGVYECSTISSYVEEGTTIFNVTDADLCKFILTIDNIENGGYGGDQSIFKLRLDKSSRCEGTAPEELLRILSPYIREHCVLQELRKYPLCRNCYGYKALSPGKCILVDNFVEKMSRISSFSAPTTCCLQTLEVTQSPKSLTDHFYESLESFAAKVWSERSLQSKHDEEEQKRQLLENAAQLKDDYQKLVSSLGDGCTLRLLEKPIFQHCTCEDCFIESGCESESDGSEPSTPRREPPPKTMLKAMKKYPRNASGIQLKVDEAVMITKSFNMGSIKCVLDLLPHTYSGLQIPNFHVGEEHSTFAAHIEDAALYAANYLHLGFPKVWITISSEFCDRTRDVIKMLKMELAHTSCVNSLSHRFFVFTTKFLEEHCIPYHITVQREGEMVVVRPNTIHFGFNCGPNVAESKNFGTIAWIPEGVKSLKWRCRCYDDSIIHLDMKILVAAFYPQLLDSLYQSSAENIQKSGVVSVSEGLPGKCRKDNNKNRSVMMKKARVVTIFKCPSSNCNIVYKGHKTRLLEHVKVDHEENASILLDHIKKCYPSKTRSSSTGLVCPVCSNIFSGSSTHLEVHFQRQIKNAALNAEVRAEYIKASETFKRCVKRRKRRNKSISTEQD